MNSLRNWFETKTSLSETNSPLGNLFRLNQFQFRFLRTFKVIVVSYFILLIICIITCQILPKYRIIIIYIIVKACLGQRKFDSKLCLIIIYEAFINVSGSIHNCYTLMTAYTYLKKSVSLICVYTRTLLQQFLQSYTIQLTAQR